VYIPDPNDAFSCPGHFEFPEEQWNSLDF
jgi:hypothetical protein